MHMHSNIVFPGDPGPFCLDVPENLMWSGMQSQGYVENFLLSFLFSPRIPGDNFGRIKYSLC